VRWINGGPLQRIVHQSGSIHHFESGNSPPLPLTPNPQLSITSWSFTFVPPELSERLEGFLGSETTTSNRVTFKIDKDDWYTDSGWTKWQIEWRYDESYTGPLVSVALLSPGQGEIWFGGDTETIEWRDGQLGEFVNIDLYRDGKPIQRIEYKLRNTGSYRWNVRRVTPLTGPRYKIAISSWKYPKNKVISDVFSIE
jgi:hypothetical protein